jgi:hypothetical protein
MKNIIKTLVVMLTSISLFGSANAGELTVNGTAKATYNILSGKTNTGKGLGITNELNFTASVELDNGYTWSYSMELDPDAVSSGSDGTAENDDSKLTVTAPWGTVGVFMSEGGLDVEDAASQSVYARPTDSGDPSSGTGDNYTIDSYNNVQFHTAADMLPFGIVGKVAYAPDLDTDKNSGNAKGNTITESTTNMGRSATEIQVSAAPIDGLKIGASYIDFDGAGLNGTKNNQNPESGAYYATYATGPFSIGYSKAYKAPLVADGSLSSTTAVDYYEQTNMSVAYAATDDLSVSYEKEEDQKNMQRDATADVEQESSSIQVAYTMGGMTLAVAHGSYDNVSYVDGDSVDQMLFAVTMAF